MRFRPTPSMLVSIVAVVIACAGSATAASLITGAQVKNGSLTGSDVKDHSLTGRDFRGSVRGPRGLRGLRGPIGPQGIQGPKGDTGATPAIHIIRESSGLVTIPAGQSIRVDARCAGQVTGGGYRVTLGAPRVVDENDAFSGEGWFVLFDNTASQDAASVEVFAYCLVTS